MRCFYFALKTATKIGKNPKPINNIERTFMIFNWIIGVFACAAIIGQVSYPIMNSTQVICELVKYNFGEFECRFEI